MRTRSPSRVCFGMEWDWGNPGLFGGKDSEISFSELGNGSSRSNISASVDSSAKAGGARVSGFSFKGISSNRELVRVEDTGTSPAVAASVGKPLIGLKLGKRTYFEDVCDGNNSKGSADSASGTPSAASVVKKAKVPSTQNVQSSHCQVEGCDVDLSGAKDYHRKHRVCETHSKSSKVIIAGQERRFCQQCSRFHDLSEFDQKKRSCRRRLSDHNARRRKLQTDAISFNSSSPFTSYYAPFGHGRSTTSSTWENSCGFSLTHTKGSCIKLAKPGGVDGRLHFSNSQLSNTVTTLPHNLDKLLSFKGTTEVLNQGLEASITRNMDGAPDLQSALSLLSTDSWGSANHTQTNFPQYVTSNHSSGAAHPTVQASNSMPGFWQDEQQQQQHLSQQAPLELHSNGSRFQEFQLFKAPHEMTFFDSSQMFSKQDGQFLEFKT